MGHVVRRINKVWNKKGQYWCNMFTVELEPADNNKDVYNTKFVDNMEVVVEPPYKSVLPPQCTNCQEIYHTKNFCSNSPKCVICGEGHSSKDCTRSKDDPPNCANCKKQHTANYGGCSYFRNNSRKAPMESARPANVNITREPFNTYDNQSFPGLRNPNSTNREYREQQAWTTPAPEVPHMSQFMDRMERLLERQMDMTNNILNMLTKLITQLSCNK